MAVVQVSVGSWEDNVMVPAGRHTLWRVLGASEYAQRIEGERLRSYFESRSVPPDNWEALLQSALDAENLAAPDEA